LHGGVSAASVNAAPGSADIQLSAGYGKTHAQVSLFSCK